MSIPLEKDYAQALMPPAVPRQLVHVKNKILETLPDTTIWHCPNETKRLLALLPHLVPGRWRYMMEGMTIEQMCNAILTRSHWRVKKIESVQNPNLEAHHDLFLRQHGIEISHPYTFHGAKPDDIEAVCEWGYTNALNRRALYGYGELYVGLEFGMARSYGSGETPQVLVMELASGGSAVGEEKQKDYGQDANGVPNLTLTDPTGTILCVKSRDQTRITYMVTSEFAGADTFNFDYHVFAGAYFTDAVKELLYKRLVGSASLNANLLRKFAPPQPAGSAAASGPAVLPGRGRGRGSAAAAGSLLIPGFSPVIPWPMQGSASDAAAGAKKKRKPDSGAKKQRKTDTGAKKQRKTDTGAKRPRKPDKEESFEYTSRVVDGKKETFGVGAEVLVEGSYSDYKFTRGQKGKVVGIYSGSRRIALIRMHDDSVTQMVSDQNKKNDRRLATTKIKEGGFPYVENEHYTQPYDLFAAPGSFLRVCIHAQKPADGAQDKKGKSRA
jgi:hypothetical protein